MMMKGAFLLSACLAVLMNQVHSRSIEKELLEDLKALVKRVDIAIDTIKKLRKEVERINGEQDEKTSKDIIDEPTALEDKNIEHNTIEVKSEKSVATIDDDDDDDDDIKRFGLSAVKNVPSVIGMNENEVKDNTKKTADGEKENQKVEMELMKGFQIETKNNGNDNREDGKIDEQPSEEDEKRNILARLEDIERNVKSFEKAISKRI